jgi:phosphoglucosamine mutase
MREKGELPKNSVVATVMSNLGFENALADAGIRVLRTAVGDRYVLEEMKRKGLALGGEQSGHVIFGRQHSTGDGLVTALQVIRVMKETGKLLTELASFMREVPQVLLNVKVSKRVDVDKIKPLKQAIAAAAKTLGREGRILVRMSGTEPKLRIMIEGRSQREIDAMASSLADLVRKHA